MLQVQLEEKSAADAGSSRSKTWVWTAAPVDLGLVDWGIGGGIGCDVVDDSGLGWVVD